MRARPLFLTSLTVFFVCLYLLVSGSPALLVVLPFGGYFPLGTLIAWLGILCLPLSIYVGHRRFREPQGRLDRFIAGLLLLVIALGACWGIAAYFVLGNWALNYDPATAPGGSRRASSTFWLVTGVLIVLPVLLLLFSLLRAGLARLRKKTRPGAGR